MHDGEKLIDRSKFANAEAHAVQAALPHAGLTIFRFSQKKNIDTAGGRGGRIAPRQLARCLYAAT
jgi:hypothetical protein